MSLGTTAPAETLDLAELKTKGALRVIVAADEAPETFALAGGPRPGLERELLEQFGRLHGRVAWAVRKEDVALRAALDLYLGNVRRGPSWSRLIVKYFGDQALAVLGRGTP